MAYNYNNPPLPQGAGGFAEPDEGQYGQHQQYDHHWDQYAQEPPFLHGGYGHQSTFDDEDQHRHPPAQNGGFYDQHMQLQGGGGGADGDNGQPPHHNAHWVPAGQHPGQHLQPRQEQLQPGSADLGAYPSYTNDTFAHQPNINPFENPTHNATNEDIPLLQQNGNAGGFVDPNQPGPGDDEDESQVRYGKIPRRIPRRLKTIKQGGLQYMWS